MTDSFALQITRRHRWWQRIRTLGVCGIIVVASIASALQAQQGPRASAKTAAAVFADAKRLDSLEQLDDARAQFAAAVRLARAESDSVILAQALYEIGFMLWSRTQYDSALVFLRQALPIQQQYADFAQLGRVYNTTGACYYQLGLYEPALEAFLSARQLRMRSSDTLGLVRTLTNIGKTYHDWGQLTRAREMLDEAITVAREHKRSDGALGYALNSKAVVAIDERRFEEAATLIAQSTAAYNASRMRTPADSVDSWELNLSATSLLLVRRGRAEEALPRLDSVLQSAARRGSVRGQTRALVHFGEASRALQDVAAARHYFTRALALSREAGQRVLVLQSLRELASLEDASGMSVAAIRHFKAYDALRDTIFSQDAATRIATREAHAETERVLQENAAQQALIGRQRVLVALGGGIIGLVLILVGVLVRNAGREKLRTAEQKRINEELRHALGEVKVLSGLIPICASCKKVRDDQGYWKAVEGYISERSDATFSHSICQTCGPQLYGELWTENPQKAGSA